MKKRICLIIISLVLLSIFYLPSAKAQTNNPGDVSQVIGSEFNISPEEIPTDPEQIKNQYLKQEWTKIIANNSVLGPIHRKLTKASPIFTILFAHPYEISLTFLSIIILWLFVAIRSSEIIKSWGIIKSGFSYLTGLILTIILSQIRVIELIATSVLNLIFAPENWWLRLIIGIISLGVLAAIYVLSRMLSQYLKQQKKAKTEEQTEQKLKELKGITKGITKYH